MEQILVPSSAFRFSNVISATHASYLVPDDFQDYSLFTLRLPVGQRLPGEAGIPEGSLGPSLACSSLLASYLSLTLSARAWFLIFTLGSHPPGLSLRPGGLFLEYLPLCVAVLLLPVDSSQASHQVVLMPPPTPPTSPPVCLFSAIGECHYSLKGSLSSKYFLHFNRLNEKSVGSRVCISLPSPRSENIGALFFVSEDWHLGHGGCRVFPFGHVCHSGP